MEELENEHDKGMGWFLFFVGLLGIGILVHNYVFNYKKEKDEVLEKEVVESFDISVYKGEWHLYDDDGEVREELSVDVVDGVTVTFTYTKGEDIYFESIVANLEDNVAYFNSETDGDYIKGRITFRDSNVFFTITDTNIENVVAGTVMFDEMYVDDGSN